MGYPLSQNTITFTKKILYIILFRLRVSHGNLSLLISRLSFVLLNILLYLISLRCWNKFEHISKNLETQLKYQSNTYLAMHRYVIHCVVKSDYNLQRQFLAMTLAQLRYVERFPTIVNLLGTLHQQIDPIGPSHSSSRIRLNLGDFRRMQFPVGGSITAKVEVRCIVRASCFTNIFWSARSKTLTISSLLSLKFNSNVIVPSLRSNSSFRVEYFKGNFLLFPSTLTSK